MNTSLRLAGVALALALLDGCGAFDETCTVCARPADSLAGFPRVERDPITGRVVSTLRVGEVAHVCIFADCGCSPSFTVDWRSSDPSVASIAEASLPLTACNDAFEVARLGSAQRVAELRGLRPGETQISAAVAGGIPQETLPALYCPNHSGCVSVEVVRVVPQG
jgi:hypothetical protein